MLGISVNLSVKNSDTAIAANNVNTTIEVRMEMNYATVYCVWHVGAGHESNQVSSADGLGSQRLYCVGQKNRYYLLILYMFRRFLVCRKIYHKLLFMMLHSTEVC